MPRRMADHMAADTPPPEEAALPATDTGSRSGGPEGVCGARCGAGRLTRGGLSPCALPWVTASGFAGCAMAVEYAGRASAGVGAAGAPGVAGRNQAGDTSTFEGSLSPATCSGAFAVRAARGAAAARGRGPRPPG